MFVLAMLMLIFLWPLLIAPRVGRLSQAKAEEVSPSNLNIRYLITGYSPLDAPEDMVSTFIANHTYLETACAASTEPHFPWQQNLRVIRASALSGELDEILVVEPSTNQSDLFRHLVSNYFPDLKVTTVTARNNESQSNSRSVAGSDTRNYEDFQYVTGAIQRAMQMVAQTEEKGRR